MNKNIITIGFMLFALFFGAGNLIYPPILGIESGTSYWIAISGFILTGVGLPILAITSISFVKSDARELADHVHPLFGLVFTSIVFLSIGPFFGIPRAATVAYEIGVEPFTGASPSSLLIFSTIFFILVFVICLNPSKMVDQIGQFLTPILLLAIIGLGIGGLLLFDNPLTPPTAKYLANPFFTGFGIGYLTMDAIGALAFGIIVVSAFKERGITDRNELIKSTLKSGIIAGVGLIIVYVSIGWIGAKMAVHGSYSNGGEILAVAANMIYGDFGTLLLGIIVVLACFTTSIGLIVAAGQFFTKVTGLPYQWIIFLVTLCSYIISNQGLEMIISYSGPVLVFIYPIMIVLIFLTFTKSLFNESKFVYRGSVLLTALVSLYDGLIEFGITLPIITRFMERLPFFTLGLGWVIPAIVGGLIGGLLMKLKRN